MTDKGITRGFEIRLEGLRLTVASIKDSRILVVDDQVANLDVLAVVLGSAGYNKVKCLSDSRQVIAQVHEFGPDLIMLDLHMPHLDGLAVMDQLATVVPDDDYLPVLMLTGDDRSETKEKALSHGAKDFLSKPLNRTEVQLRVRNLLQTRHLHVQLRAQNGCLADANRALETTNRTLKETQAHLIQSEKMASMGQLVAGIAHEINNPLAYVISNIFVVQKALKWLVADELGILPPDVLPRMDKARLRADEAREGAERVKDLVLKLRTFSRLDEGEVKTVNVHESIDSVLLLLTHKMENRIQVERRFGVEEDLLCCAGELNQVLMNLIDNAVESIDGPGTITLTTAQQIGHFVITVRDTGRGIPEEIRGKVFEPFFTTKPVGHGAGLGLAISYGIIKAHRGTMEFSSKPGEGTEFVLTIPNSRHRASHGLAAQDLKSMAPAVS